MLHAVSFLKTDSLRRASSALAQINSRMFRLSRGDRSTVPNVVVIVTTGVTRSDVLERANELRNSGVEIFSVALGERPNMAIINGMASDSTDDHVIQLEDKSKVASAANQLLAKLC